MALDRGESSLKLAGESGRCREGESWEGYACVDVTVCSAKHPRGGSVRQSGHVLLDEARITGKARTKLRIVTLRFGTGRQKMVLERWTKPQRRTSCSPRYGL